MIKINKIIFASMLLLGAGCTTVKKFFGVNNEEEHSEEVIEAGEPTVETVDVSFPASQTYYTEFLIVCLLVITGLCLLRYFLNKK